MPLDEPLDPAATQPSYQPSNITWACMPPHEDRKLKKRERYTALAARALGAVDAWVEEVRVPLE